MPAWPAASSSSMRVSSSGAPARPRRPAVATRVMPALVQPHPSPIDAALSEMEVEGLLHVTAVQAGACSERFGGDPLDAPALAAPSLSSALSGLEDDSARSRLVEQAVCLATPPENPGESTRRPEEVVRQAQRALGAARPRPAGLLAPAEGEGEGAAGEAPACGGLGAACHRGALLNTIYTTEVLEASAAVRRQRRRQLMRLLRRDRDARAKLLAAPVAALSSLGSLWDANDDGGGDGRQ